MVPNVDRVSDSSFNAFECNGNQGEMGIEKQETRMYKKLISKCNHKQNPSPLP